MDLKKKFENAKEKCKQNAPIVVAVVSSAVAVGFAVAYSRLKEETVKQCDKPRDETHLYLTDESIGRLRAGAEALFEPLDDLHLVLHKDDHLSC